MSRKTTPTTAPHHRGAETTQEEAVEGEVAAAAEDEAGLEETELEE
jgi:hypothetical protein